METGGYINWILGMLLQKVVVPGDYHAQADVIKQMLTDDVSGLVDSLTDFAVETASVDFTIESENQNLSKILQEWLYTLNAGYQGKVPVGIQALAKEYFKERWKGASFPVLKIAKWEKVGNMMLPTRMFFVDGGSVYAKEIKDTENSVNLVNYDYYLGKDMNPSNKLGKHTILAKSSGRWFDEYPVPFLVKRGVYHNWKIVQSLKNKEIEILEQIIPYMMLVKKGTDALATNDVKVYTDEELKAVKEQFQKLLDELKNNQDTSGNASTKSPIRATQYDESIEHIIPDLMKIFDPKLFAQAERNILAGLGFIDVVQGISDSRRESILNPKVFVEEVKNGVDDFKDILKQLLFLIIEKNKTHIKYINEEIHISNSPVKGFMTDDFKEKIRQLYDRGRISSQTAVELIGEVDFRTEVYRREQEAKKGIDQTMYPPVRDNIEEKAIDLPSDFDEETVPDDKKDPKEKKNFENSSKNVLETAPYTTVKSLPSRIKNNMDVSLQRVFIRVFNTALKQYNNETKAFRVAWSVIRQLGRKGTDGKWQRKRTRSNGKLKTAKLTEKVIIKAMKKVHKSELEDTIKNIKLDNEVKKNKLLSKLLGKTEEKK